MPVIRTRKSNIDRDKARLPRRAFYCSYRAKWKMPPLTVIWTMNAFSPGINPTKNVIVIGRRFSVIIRTGSVQVISNGARERRTNDWALSRYVRQNKLYPTVLSAAPASLGPFNHPLTHFSPYLRGTFKKVSLESQWRLKIWKDNNNNECWATKSCVIILCK